MPNINKNIIMQAGAAVANATNKAAGLTASTPEPGAIISAIQLVNGGRTIGPDALAHFTESVRNKLLSLLVSMEPIQSGSGTPSPDNVRPINGRTGLNIYVSPTPNAADANTYAVDWTSEAGTVYGGTVDVVTGVLTVDRAMVDLGTLTWGFSTTADNVKCYYSNDISTLIKPVASHNDTPDMISSKYQAIAWNSRLSVTNGISMLSSGQLRIIDSNYQSESALSDFTASLSGVQLCYELATPHTYQLTRTDIVTLVGDNYIWSDSGDVTITE